MPDHTEDALGKQGSSPKTSGWQLREGGRQHKCWVSGPAERLSFVIFSGGWWIGRLNDRLFV